LLGPAKAFPATSIGYQIGDLRATPAGHESYQAGLRHWNGSGMAGVDHGLQQSLSLLAVTLVTQETGERDLGDR